MNRSTRTVLVVVIALATASAASYLVYRAIQRIPVREVEVASAFAVVAATHLPVGTLVTKEQVKLVPWPAAHQVPGAFTSIDQVANRGVIQPVAANEPLTESKLAPLGAGAGLSPTIPSGMRAISVKVNEVIGVAGFVVPGSRVDVLVTVDEGGGKSGMARAVVSNVQVLTAGTRFDQEKARADGKPIPTTVVTLLATPQDAERITLAAAEGKIMLTLRNPLDVNPTETQGTRMANLMGAPAAPPVEKVIKGRKVVVPPPPPPPPPAPYTVESWRGGKRSVNELGEVVK
jgi:pilus assembly protein CpaB